MADCGPETTRRTPVGGAGARRLGTTALGLVLLAGGCQPSDVATKRDLARLGAEIKALRQQRDGASMRDVLQPLTEQLGAFDRRAAGRDQDWQGLLGELRAVVREAAGPELDPQSRQGLAQRIEAIDRRLRKDITGLERDRDLVLRALESTVTRLDEFLRAAAPWGGPADIVTPGTIGPNTAAQPLAGTDSATRPTNPPVGDGPAGDRASAAAAGPAQPAAPRKPDLVGWLGALAGFGALALVAFWARLVARDELPVVSALPTTRVDEEAGTTPPEHGVNGGELAQLIGTETTTANAPGTEPPRPDADGPTANGSSSDGSSEGQPEPDDFDGLLFAIDEEDPAPAIAEPAPVADPVVVEAPTEEPASEPNNEAAAATANGPVTSAAEREPGQPVHEPRAPREGPPAEEVFAIDFGRDFEPEAPDRESATTHASEVLDEVAPETKALASSTEVSPEPVAPAPRRSALNWREHTVPTTAPEDAALQVQGLLSSDPRVLQEPAPTTRVAADQVCVRLMLAPAVDDAGWDRFKAELSGLIEAAPSGHG